MRHALRVGVFMLAMGLVGSPWAEAGGLWDWLEELNGPGPSAGRRPPLMASLFCTGAPLRGKSEESNAGLKVFRKAFQIVKDPDKPSSCLYWDYHAFHAADDIRFYPVDTSMWEIGTTVRLHRTLEIGGGFGRLSFSSRNTDSDANPEITGGRATVTFPRVVFKPLLAIPKVPNHASWGFLQIYFKQTIVFGELTQDDFASKPGNEFSRTNQRVDSVGFVIDLSALLNFKTNQ